MPSVDTEKAAKGPMRDAVRLGREVNQLNWLWLSWRSGPLVVFPERSCGPAGDEYPIIIPEAKFVRHAEILSIY